MLLLRRCRYQPDKPSATGRPKANDLYRKPIPMAIPSSSGISQREANACRQYNSTQNGRNTQNTSGGSVRNGRP